jgi:hypothetical protein
MRTARFIIALVAAVLLAFTAAGAIAADPPGMTYDTPGMTYD